MGSHLQEHFSDQKEIPLATHCSPHHCIINRIADCSYLHSNFNRSYSSHHSSSHSFAHIGTLSTMVEHFRPGPLAQATAHLFRTVKLMQSMVVFVQSH